MPRLRRLSVVFRANMPLALTAVLVLSVCEYASTAEPDSSRLRVLCYNIHHGEGTDGKVALPRLAEVILGARPDLVALQEVDNRTDRTGGVDQTAELARLTGLHGRFCKQIDYEGGEYGQAVLSRFPLSEPTIHWLPGMPERERRIAAEVQFEAAGQKFSLVTTHLHHNQEQLRQQQAAKLNEIFAGSDRPVILAGDLNANPDSEPLRILSQEWLVATSDRPLATYPSGEPANQIDYILARPRGRFRVISVEVLPEPVASDHRPVLAVIELR
ncbi:endonuclease/exonuclease/phosphatase family protein [Planctellipticum variicoloris]|uniref:endonuclease/exonuclease/phosphatase family protein n=1 Tax=Planctellipticum variicoloris TaxID=3064265 RepID=UPI0030136865|nr:endonuclease/exonuclease/phosphatase family protein [Planctomycetaceae bacterium SH412]